MIWQRICPGAGNAWGFVVQHRSEVVMLTLLGGIFGGLAVVGGCASPETLRMMERGQVTDRFTRAIAQLDDAKLERRLGAIYTLERIARDSEDAHEPVMEVLTAYVREHPSCMADKAQEEKNRLKQEVQPKDPRISEPREISRENQAVLRVLGRRSRTYEKGETERLDLRCSHLEGAKLAAAHLEGANLHAAYLQAANLSGTHLEKAILSYAELSWANLTDVHLEGALVAEAQLGSANLTRANLVDAILFDARLAGANLTDANLEGTDLRGKTGLTPSQVKLAKNWDQGFYDGKFLAELGLPSDHNARLAEKFVKEKRERKR